MKKFLAHICLITIFALTLSGCNSGDSSIIEAENSMGTPIEPGFESAIGPTIEPEIGLDIGQIGFGPENSNSVTNNATHTITVIAVGGGDALATPEMATVGTNVSLTASKGSWYTFKQWEAIKPTNLTISNNTNNNVTFTMPNSDVEIKAVFTPVTFNIEYYNEDGTAFTGNISGLPTKHTGDKDTALPIVSNRELAFLCWYLEPECKNKVDKLTAYTDYPSTIKLYAQWIYYFPELMKRFGKISFSYEGITPYTKFYCSGDYKYIFKYEYTPPLHPDHTVKFTYEINNSIPLKAVRSNLVGQDKWVYEDENTTISVYIYIASNKIAFVEMNSSDTPPLNGLYLFH